MSFPPINFKLSGVNNILGLGVGTQGQVLQAGGSTNNPAFSTATYPSTATSAGTILRADGTNWVATTNTYPNTDSKGDLLYASAANVISGLSIDTYTGSPLIVADSGLPAWGDLSNYVILTDEFLGQNPGGTQWGNTGAGGGLASQTNSTVSGSQVGVWNMFTNASTTGASMIQQQQSLVVGNGFISQTFYARIPTLSVLADRFTIVIGMSNGGGTITPSDGFWFQYSDNVNSGNWTIVTSSSSTQTTANTSTAADTSWHKFTITVNAAGTSVAFFIDGSQVSGSPLSTHIPSAQIGPWMGIVKSLGTNSKNVYVDYWSLYIKLTSPR